MKKKGFVFIETIIVIVVLTVGMIAIYSSFSSVLNNGKRRSTYDDVAYIYRSYYIQEFLSSLDMEKYIEKYKLSYNSFISFSCGDVELYKLDSNKTTANDTSIPVSQTIKEHFCSNLLLNFDVSKLYITYYNISDIKKCTTSVGKASGTCTNQTVKSTVAQMGTGVVHYLRTIRAGGTGYRIIVVYNDKVKEYSTVTKVNNKCPDSYNEDAKGCYRELNRPFYSNMKMVIKSDL